MILALDIGTTNFKAGVFLKGELIKVCYRPLEVIDGYKTDGESWFTAFKSVVRELNESLDLSSLRSIILDGNGPTLVSVPSNEALLWLDRRAQEESVFLSEKLGFFVDSSFLIPKILRQKRLYPELYKKTKLYFGSADYLAWKLTGEAKIVMALEGLEKWYWNDELLDSLEIDKSKLPPFIKMGEKIGNLTDDLAEELGIKPVPVLSGPPDFVTSILGSGTVEIGTVCDRSGTSEGINLCSKLKNSNQKLMCYRHPNGENWNISGIISTSGKSIEFVKNLLGMEKMPYEKFYEFVSKGQPGSNGVIFHPYLAGERAPIWDSKATGSFTGLTLNTERKEIAKSVC
ncbi:MAG: FGGY family carbohydrate kinase, partial [Sphaerochaetaceae bacterium]